MQYLLTLGSEEGHLLPWYHGIHVMEATELYIIFLLFVGTLITVYYIQRWIGDY